MGKAESTKVLWHEMGLKKKQEPDLEVDHFVLNMAEFDIGQSLPLS